MKYRIANVNDCKELTRIRMEMRKERDENFTEEALYENTLDYFMRRIKDGSHVAFVCEDEGQIIATVGISLFEMLPTTQLLNGKVAKLMNMYVVPAYRQKGIAYKLLDLVTAYSKENGYTKIMLSSSPMGEELYRTYGFKPIPSKYEMYLE